MELPEINESRDQEGIRCNGPFCSEKECPGKIDYENKTCKGCIKNAEDALEELNRNHYH